MTCHCVLAFVFWQGRMPHFNQSSSTNDVLAYVGRIPHEFQALNGLGGSVCTMKSDLAPRKQLAPENGWLENDPFLLGLGAARQVQAVGFQGIQHMGIPCFFSSEECPSDVANCWFGFGSMECNGIILVTTVGYFFPYRSTILLSFSCFCLRFLLTSCCHWGREELGTFVWSISQ